MASNGDIMRLCRLCLVKDEVNIPIFDDHSSVQQIFMKISSCLPVTISKDDKLPKKICDGCSGKLDMLYQFWNTSAKAEKQLLLWLNQAGINFEKTKMDTNSSASEQSINKAVDSSIVKQENEDYVEGKVETSEISTEAKSYILQQQQLPYQKEFSFPEKDPVESGASVKSSETEEPPPKRARRAAAMKAPIQAIDSDDEDDEVDDIEPITKTEDESEDSGREEDNDPSFEPASVSADDQPGPSGVGKGSADASLITRLDDMEPIITLTEHSSWMKKIPEIEVTVIGEKRKPKKIKKADYKNPFIYKKSDAKPKILKKIEMKNTKWACMICSEIKPNKEELIKHYECHKHETESLKAPSVNGDYFMCPVCLTEFTSLKSYEKHVELHHGEKQYMCDICQKPFKNLLSLCLHNFNAHSVEKIYKCVLCDFSGENQKSLKAHVKASHEDHFKYRCEICSKGFTSLSWYEEHKNFHTGAMPFECDVCSKSFPYTRYLIAHKKSMHPEIFSDVPINHECSICQKKFAHKKSLVLHVRGHTGENAVLCEMCGKSLSSAEHLKQHIRIHTGFKPYACTICGKGFAKKCNLTLHERVHSGEKPHICNVCGKAFSQRSTLVIHGRYHSGERPYVCQLCNRGFVAKGLLGVHLKACSGIP